MATTAPKPPPREKFSLDRTTNNGITRLTLQGTVNVSFEGRKLAESIRANKVVVDMRHVRRFASWGMSEWMDFLRATADRDVYIVECSAYALSQLNLVTGLLGHAKLVSYYASFRCAACSEELETLFIIPRDREMIRYLPGSQQDCPTCGGRARLEEYPQAFFETIADRPSFDIDDEVLALLRSHFRYDLAPDLTRFRAHRSVRGGYTYVRLSGSFETLPVDKLLAASQNTTVLDLERVVVDPAKLDPWRAYLTAALAKVKSLQLLHCPIGFLETAVSPEDLRDKLKVRTFVLPYECMHCERTSEHLVDVADNLEYLASGSAPTVGCPTCRASLVAAVTQEQAKRFRALPARERDAALDKFLSSARGEPVEKLENCLVALPEAAPAQPARTGSRLQVALGLTTLLVVCLAAVGIWQWKDRTENRTVVPRIGVVPTPPTASTFTRPDWIVSGAPSSAYCHDMINRLMCVGVSSYRRSRDEAVTEANDAALEELVNAVGLKISDPFFREHIAPTYSGVRAKALSGLQLIDLERKGDPAANAAREGVLKARRRVVENLSRSGGAAVPTQRSDWYWEEYAGERGNPNETMVFVRYDVSLDAVRALVGTYSTASSVRGTTALTGFPGLAWDDADFAGGAILTSVGRPLASAGIGARDIVVAVGSHAVTDAGVFARRFEEAWQGSDDAIALGVKTGKAPKRVVAVER